MRCAAALLGALALVGALGPAARAGEVKGRLLYLDDRPVANRAVEVLDDTWERSCAATTDASGSFTVSTDGLGTGLTLMISRSAGFFLLGLPTAGDVGAIHIPRPAIVKGILVDAAGNPWAGRPVDAGMAMTYVWTTPSDAEGRFAFEVAPGIAAVGITLTSFDDRVEVPFRAEAGESVEVTIDPRPKPAASVRFAASALEEKPTTAYCQKGSLFSAFLAPLAGKAAPIVPRPGRARELTSPNARPIDLPPGSYRLLVYEGANGLFGGGLIRRRAATVTIAPGPNEIVAGPISATPILLEVEVGGAPTLDCFTFPLAPPVALDAATYERWPLDGPLGVADTSVNPQYIRTYNVDWPDVELPEEGASVVHRHLRVFEPGAMGLAVIAGEASALRRLSVTRERQRIQLQPATSGAALAFKPTAKRVAARLDPRFAILVGPDGQVKLALPLARGDGDEGARFAPRTIRGLAPGKYDVRWWFAGFAPRSAPVVLKDGETTEVVLEP